MSRDLIAEVRVGARLLLQGPFPSLYVFAVQRGVKFQCDDVDEARVRARAWGLTSYSHYVSKDREYHAWSGVVDGTDVEVVAAPGTPVGPIPPESDDPLDPLDPLEELARGAGVGA